MPVHPARNDAAIDQRVNALQNRVAVLSERLESLLAEIPTLQEFADARIREQLAKDHPGADVDPEKTLVYVEYLDGRPPDPPLPRVLAYGPPRRTRIETPSLRDALLEKMPAADATTGPQGTRRAVWQALSSERMKPDRLRTEQNPAAIKTFAWQALDGRRRGLQYNEHPVR